MNRRLRLTCLFLGITAGLLLSLSPLYANEGSAPGRIIKGTLLHKDEKPVSGKTIYFFSVYYIKNSKTLSAETSFKDGRIANPNSVTDEKGCFTIDIPGDFLKKTDSKQFSVGIIRGFGPGFTILRNPDGSAATIDIDPADDRSGKSSGMIDIGRIILE